METAINSENFTCKIEHGAMTDAPVYEDHTLGKNWMAVISADPKAPGGLRRIFLGKANGDYYYLVDGLKVGQAIEFGADRYSHSRKNRRVTRWYGVVVSITDNELILAEASSPKEAMERSNELLQNGASKLTVLQLEREQLMVRLAEIQSEIASLTTASKKMEVFLGWEN